FADGQPVSSPSALISIVGSHSAGETVILMVIDTSNGFNSRNVTIGLAARPANLQTPPQRLASKRGNTNDEIYDGFNDFKAPGPGEKDPLIDYQPDNETYDSGQDANPLSVRKTGRQTAQASDKRGKTAAVHGVGSFGATHLVPVGMLRGQYCRALAPA